MNTPRPINSSSEPWFGADYSSYVEHRERELQESGQTATILVVDDDTRMLQSVEALLNAYGYSCITADGGKAALKILEQQKVDLLLLDLNMPGIDGRQVMQTVAEHFPTTDIVVVSGETTYDNATHALRHGAQDFLRKPYLSDELAKVVKNILHKRHLERDVTEMHQRLKYSEQVHRFIVNNSPDIVYMLDENGRFSFLNERIKTLLGFCQEELIGKHYSELVHTDDLEAAKYAFAEKRSGNRSTQNVEFRLVCKDGNQESKYFESRSITIELSAIGVYSKTGNLQDRMFVGTYGVARDITERKEAEELINFQIYHDLLTKLPNRALFQDRLEIAIIQAKRSDCILGIMYLDMDNFKAINDSLGHLAGDQLLQIIADLLHGCLREGDTLARVGGDEFNLLLPGIAGRDDATKIATKIHDRFKSPISLQGNDIFVSFSIGIAVFPDDGESFETLVKNADTAMYHIKRQGKNGYAFFSGKIKTPFLKQLAVENGIRRALEENQFQVFFQPQYTVDTGNLVGVEALLRWQHPVDGMVLPADFIPVAEETGQITDIGNWVLDSACGEIRRMYPNDDSLLSLAVNISASQLIQGDFVSTVLDTLNRHRFPYRQLELEITENVLMKDMEQAISTLKKLTYHGVRIAVDDFGTGYSSLSYLHSLPLHTLKIDRSFIQRIHSLRDKASIVTAIIAMAKELELDLVAEGVETKIQLDFLQNLGCPKAQGFLLGHPAPASALVI